VESSDVIWDPNEDTKVALDSEDAAKALSAFVEALQDYPQVQGVYANAAQGSIADDVWEDLEGKLDS